MRRKYQNKVRNLYLPSRLKRRMNPDRIGVTDWMIEEGELTGASSIAIKLHLEHRPWDVILTVKRRHNDHGNQKR